MNSTRKFHEEEEYMDATPSVPRRGQHSCQIYTIHRHPNNLDEAHGGACNRGLSTADIMVYTEHALSTRACMHIHNTTFWGEMIHSEVKLSNHSVHLILSFADFINSSEEDLHIVVVCAIQVATKAVQFLHRNERSLHFNHL